MKFASGRDVIARGTVARGVALADQLVSGLSNFLAVALVARSSTPVEFGQFSIAYALFIAAVGLSRQLWGTRISLTASPERALSETRRLLGAGAVFGPVVGGIIAVPSLLLAGGDVWVICAFLGVGLPIVVGQDLCRYAAVAAGRPSVALVSDLVWVVVVGVGYVARPAMEIALLVWLGGALCALILALSALRVGAQFSDIWTTVRFRHSTAEVGAVGFITTSMATYLVLGLATVSLSATAAGALRGASTVMAPMNSLFAFVGLALLPVLFRVTADRHARIGLQISLTLSMLTVSWGVVLLLIPDQVGYLLMGASWPGVRAVLPWTVLEYLFLAIGLGPYIALQARQRARSLSFVLAATVSFTVLGACVVAALDMPVEAFAGALACGAAASAICAWSIFQKGARQNGR